MVAIQVNNQQWTPYQLQAGVNASFFVLGQQVVYVSESQTPTDDYMPFSEINITPQAPTTLYFKTQYSSAIVIFATDISTSGGGGGGGGTPPAPTYSFQAPLVNNGGNVSIALSQSLQVTQNRLDLNLNADPVFRNALLDISEALRIADYTSVGRVMPMQDHFQLNALTGELSLDLSPTGALAQNFASPTDLQAIDQKVTANTQNIARHDNEIADLDQQINLLETGKADVADLQALEQKVNTNTQDITQAKGSITSIDGRLTTAEGAITTNTQDIQTLRGDLTTLGNGVVKTGNENQDIDGVKNFLKGLEALALQLRENAVGVGALDINNSQGYISISQTTQGILQLLAGLGFIDGTTTFRIRNLAGGLVTFNTVVQYEQTFTPTDDKDLVPLATVNQVKADLLALIQSVQGGIVYVGLINHTKAEVEAQPDLLTQFVQQTASRQPRNGDFVKTTDSYGFIYNGTNWANFGQVSISIATTTQAGIVMLGTQAGELEDIGGGKAKVIGWDTITQALIDLDRRISANAQNIQQIQTSLSDYARLTGDNTFTGNNTFNNPITIPNATQDTQGANLGDIKGYAIPKVTTTAVNSIQVTSNAQKIFNFDYIWDNAQAAYRNWSGIKLRCKTQSASAFTDMFVVEYREDDNLGIFMGCVGNKLTFTSPTKISGGSCEDTDSDDTLATKLFVTTKMTSSIGDLTNLTTTDKSNIVSAINEVDSESVKTSGNQNIAGNKTFQNATTFSDNINLSKQVEYRYDDNNDYGIRFQCDSVTRTRDMIRIHKAGDKWDLRIVLNTSGAFDYAEIAGNTRITKLLSAQQDTHAANLGDVKRQITTSLAPYKKAVIIATGGSLPATTDADTIYYTEV